VTDADCVDFLRFALPRLGLRWEGFRKVRRQVCRRIADRLEELGLPDLASYRARLETDPAEWAALDALCRVTISRFARDRGVWEALQEIVLPELARAARGERRRALRAWSAGCASGEEPYTLALLWALELTPDFPGLGIEIIATDVDEAVLARARRALYPASSLRELPERWRDEAFVPESAGFHLRPEHREAVRFLRHDVRTTPPDGPFDLVLCRNLAFTYFDERGRRVVAALLAGGLRPGGALVLGSHETLPADCPELEPWPGVPLVHRRLERPADSPG
jgi:chemotaxis protein methyltransferase CheR